MQIVSSGDNFHEMSKPVFWEKCAKYFKMLLLEIFTQNVQCEYVNVNTWVRLFKRR